MRDYLVSKGVDKAKIETIGMGEKQPVVQCDQKNMKALIACLQPNRRVRRGGEGRDDEVAPYDRSRRLLEPWRTTKKA